MDTDEFMQAIIGCKNYILSQAAKHEQAACYARYVYERDTETAEQEEQQVLLRWATALGMVLEENRG